MLRSAVKVRVLRPLDEVFAYITNPQNDLQWNAELRAVRGLPARPLMVDDTYEMVFAGKNADGSDAELVLTQKVAKLESNVRFEFTTISGSSFPVQGAYTFTAAENGTIVQYMVTYEIGEDLPERVLKDLKREINKRLEVNFSQLKTLLDENSAS